jgi:aminopeptidase N
MKNYLLYICISLFPVFNLKAQNHYERLEKIDVDSYEFSIAINDDNDIIKGSTLVKIQFKKDIENFQLDLLNKNSAGKGMTVSKLETLLGDKIPFSHENDKIKVLFKAKAGTTNTFRINYSGIPVNGLVIAKNKYGDRTFFGDNWPNRAYHWLPTVDHPSDKAKVEWVITAPNHYQVIANGRLIEETDLDDHTRITKWKTQVPLATKVMVFGAARFAVEQVGEIYNIPVSSWVYPQNRAEGFYDYEMAYEILDWFINHVGPYPYAKLANVQSKTMFGGMENAGNIFYSERSVSGERKIEGLLAHEIAHQWFGNSASEGSWHHSWLSEGFATYFTNLYNEQTHGRDKLVSGLKGQRNNVINYSKKAYVPIVNPDITEYMKVLSTNTYQKGGWVLHMLRKEVGDEDFWKGIRTYYARYEHSNAYSDDLRAVFEEVTGEDLESFFKQWVLTAGHPDFQLDWTYNGNKLNVLINQHQKTSFQFPLEIELVFQDGSTQRETLDVNKSKQTFELNSTKKPVKIVLDPDTWLLFEGTVSEK